MADASVVHRLYDAFQARDGAAMQACYTDDATFRDPVFQLSGAEEIGAMWTMLLEQGDDLEIEVSGIQADATRGRAHWDATYSFGPAQRRVVNRIDASFVLVDDRIAEHEDRFDLWRWTRQALGPTGALLGWSPLVRNKVRAQARRGLERWRSNQ